MKNLISQTRHAIILKIIEEKTVFIIVVAAGLDTGTGSLRDDDSSLRGRKTSNQISHNKRVELVGGGTIKRGKKHEYTFFCHHEK